MIPAEAIHPFNRKCQMKLVHGANAGSCASNRMFGKCCMHVLYRNNIVSLITISSDSWFHWAKDPITDIFPVLWLGKVILRDSDANSFPNVSYGRHERVVMVTTCFVTPKAHSGNVGLFLFQSLQCVFNDWADCIPVLLAGIKDVSIWFQLDLANAEILSYDGGYMPAEPSFPKPIGLLLTIFHLKKLHGPVQYNYCWCRVDWLHRILFSLFLIYQANNVRFPLQDVCSCAVKVIQKIFMLLGTVRCPGCTFNPSSNFL